MTVHSLPSHEMPRFLGMTGGGSAIQEILLGILILGSGIAYIIWLVKRKL
jgi:hypothetical protein